MPYFAEYAATKHYMSAFTAGLRAELGRGSGVVIQEVDPGQVDTNMARNLIPISRVRDTLEESVVFSILSILSPYSHYYLFRSRLPRPRGWWPAACAPWAGLTAPPAGGSTASTGEL